MIPRRYVRVDRLGPGRFPSPLRLSAQPGAGCGQFTSDSRWVRDRVQFDTAHLPAEELLFEKAGARQHLFFDPSQTRAAVVTCGGLCPGLNNVVRSLFMELHYNYGVAEVLGIRDGYAGLNPAEGRPPLTLTREFVSNIHREGGTMLGSSRGPQETARMVDFLAHRGVSILFTVGGDGTQRGAAQISDEARRRGLPLAVIGIPKTIDCDVLYCDRTFGYSTAVEKAQEVIHLAHTEAKGAARGIGLVKLMGRDAGFIACGATLVSQEANFVLIPEAPFALEGEHGFLAALERRMQARDHAVVVVAEGAGQHLFDDDDAQETDASGNVRYHDIGVHLKQEIGGYFRRRGCPVTVKYIDPSYIIRSVPANCDDSALCDLLARNAVHAAMAGRTGALIGLRNNTFLHVPIAMAVERKRRVDLEGHFWAAVLATTGQPLRFTADDAARA